MIPYVREMEVAYGRADRVSPRITRVLAENPGPFTFHGTGTYLVAGAGDVAVIDPGPLLQAHLEALLRALDGRRVSHILLTHTHADHSSLAKRLQDRVAAPIVGRRSPSSEAEILIPDVEIADGAVLEGANRTLRAIVTPGHASNHMAYALEEERALFCGDHIMGWSTTVVSPPDGDMSAYYRSLERVAEEDFLTLWPTHGPPITEVQAFLTGYREHRLKREEQIERELARGPRGIESMAARLYAGVDTRLTKAAERSLWAHLIHMAREGRVTADGPATLEATYSLAPTTSQD